MGIGIQSYLIKNIIFRNEHCGSTTEKEYPSFASAHLRIEMNLIQVFASISIHRRVQSKGLRTVGVAILEERYLCARCGNKILENDMKRHVRIIINYRDWLVAFNCKLGVCHFNLAFCFRIYI